MVPCAFFDRYNFLVSYLKRKWNKSRLKFQKKIIPGGASAGSTAKARPLPYTREEDSAVLKFIVKNRRFGDTGGIALWNTMEHRKIVPNRYHHWKWKFKYCIIIEKQSITLNLTRESLIVSQFHQCSNKYLYSLALLSSWSKWKIKIYLCIVWNLLIF